MISIRAKNRSYLEPIRQSVPVTFRYDVHFTQGLLELDNPLLAQVINGDSTTPKKAIAIIDSGLLQHHSNLLQNLESYAQCYSEYFAFAADPIVVTGGEESKNDPQIVQELQATIEQAGLCRHSYVIAIGGGAVLDMAGYGAATAHRGLRLIRVPTTVLAQNDSGVGVKNGINAFGKKNFLGTFAPPYAVLNDTNWLATLEDRDWRSGIAEAVKVALIKDASFFNFINNHAQALAERDTEKMQQLIYRCAQLHLEHIAGGGDPFEAGSSRPLDFGHWAAHRLEHLSKYQLRHGEAVAIGIALDSTYSYLCGLLSWHEWQRILKTLRALGFTLYVSELNTNKALGSTDCLFLGLIEFQEHIGGELNITLLEGIGQGVEVGEVNIPLYRQAIFLLEVFTHQSETESQQPRRGKIFPFRLHKSLQENHEN